MGDTKKIKLYCIKKLYDKNGKITKYMLSDELGHTGECERREVIEHLKLDDGYELVNLQLDKTNRIVDKPIKNEDKIIKELTERSKSDDINLLFDRAYRMMSCYNFVIILTRFNNSEINYTEPFENLKGKLSIEQLQSKFESYIMQKYKVKLTKLTVLHKSGDLFIEYGLSYVNFTYLDNDRFKHLDSIKNYKISCNVENKDTYIVHKYIDTVADKKAGGIIEDAFLGIIAYDKQDEESANWADKHGKDLEKEIKKLRYSKKHMSNEKLQALKKSSEQSVKNNNSEQSESKIEEFGEGLLRRTMRRLWRRTMMRAFLDAFKR